jgi:hypothetical protein
MRPLVFILNSKMTHHEKSKKPFSAAKRDCLTRLKWTVGGIGG